VWEGVWRNRVGRGARLRGANCKSPANQLFKKWRFF